MARDAVDVRESDTAAGQPNDEAASSELVLVPPERSRMAATLGDETFAAVADQQRQRTDDLASFIEWYCGASVRDGL